MGLALAAIAASVLLPVLVAALWPRAALTVALVDHGLSVILTCAVMVVAGLRGSSRLRRSRLLFAAALAATSCGFAMKTWYAATLGAVPAVSPADAVMLMWVPLCAAGLLSLPLASGGAGARLRACLDGIIAASALLFASWVAVLQPVYSSVEAGGLTLVTALAYPITDLIIAVIALGVTSHATQEMRRLLRLLTGGLLLIALSDSAGAVQAAAGSIAFSWTDITLQAGLGLLVLGVILPPSTGANEQSRLDAAVDAALPFLPIVVAAGFGLQHTLSGNAIGRGASLIGAVMLLALIWRQLLYSLQLGSLARSLAADASHDSLTGLANRTAFIRELGSRLPDVAPGTLAVVMLDLNGFKEINDGYGHSAGDRALIAFAARLRQVTTAAVAARLGGDEFALMLVGPDAEAGAVACAAAATIGSPIRIGALDVPLAASAGIAVNRAGDAASDLLRRADLAMYEAKRSPLSLTAVFTDDMASRADRRNLLAQALPGAGERGELHLVYQPLYRLTDRTLAGAEALLRWQSPRHGDVSPEEFISLAEDTGAIREIGDWVLETALRQLNHWQSVGLTVPRLFVNASSHQFTEDFAATVLEKADRYGIAREVLTLEVTESSVPDLEANRALRSLRDAGVRIAMDDFGAGFSSLAQLARLPVDTLKIDREFVRGADTENGRRILASVIALATDLGLTTVAEGIELPEQVDVVARAGCTLAQGYHFARPLSAHDLARLLSSTPTVPAPRGSTAVVEPLA